MPHLIQPSADDHYTHRSTASLRNQTDNQPDESPVGAENRVTVPDQGLSGWRT
jgi:hypothetical protein